MAEVGCLNDEHIQNIEVDGFTNFKDFVSTSSDKGIMNGDAGVSGLAAVVTTTGTLALATHSSQVGKYVEVAADAQTLTLPELGSVGIGASFIIVNTAPDGEALLTISPHADDMFLVDIAGAGGTNNKDIINTKATQKQFDYVHLIGWTADGWLIHNRRGIWIDQA